MLPYIKVTHHRSCHVQVKNLLSFRIMSNEKGQRGRWDPVPLSLEVVQHISPLNKHYWHFLIPPSGPTSGSKRCWKMESWGPGMHSFDASTLNFGEVVQHISPLNKHYWHFLIPPSGPASGSRRCWKLDSCSQGAQSYGDFHISFLVLWANTINT